MQVRVVTSTVEDLSTVSGTGSLTSQMVSGIDSHNQNFYLVNQGSQMVATVSNLFPALAPFRIQTNVAAAATVFLKMELDVQEGKSIEPGDVLTLVGDVAGVVATVALFAAAPEVEIAAVAVAVASDVAGIISSFEQSSLASFTNQFASENLTSTPTVPTDGTWYLTSNGQLMTTEEISASGLSYGTVRLNVDGTGFQLAPIGEPAGSLSEQDIEGAGDGASDWGDGDGDGDGGDGGDGGGDWGDGDGGDGDDEAAHTQDG